MSISVHVATWVASLGMLLSVFLVSGLVANGAGAYQLVAVSGEGQNAPLGGQLVRPLVLKVTDTLAQPAAGVTVTFSFPGGTLVPASAASDASGLVSVQVTMPATVSGNYLLTATVEGGGTYTTFFQALPLARLNDRLAGSWASANVDHLGNGVVAFPHRDAAEPMHFGVFKDQVGVLALVGDPEATQASWASFTATTGSGVTHVLYTTSGPGGFAVRDVTSSAGALGAAVSLPITSANPFAELWDGALVAGKGNTADFVYSTRGLENSSKVYVTHFDGTTWGAPTRLDIDTLNTDAAYVSAAHDTHGAVVAAWSEFDQITGASSLWFATPGKGAHAVGNSQGSGTTAVAVLHNEVILAAATSRGQFITATARGGNAHAAILHPVYADPRSPLALVETGGKGYSVFTAAAGYLWRYDVKGTTAAVTTTRMAELTGGLYANLQAVWFGQNLDTAGYLSAYLAFSNGLGGGTNTYHLPLATGVRVH